MKHRTESKVNERQCIKMFMDFGNMLKIGRYFGVHQRVIKDIITKNGLKPHGKSWHATGERNSAWRGGRVYEKGYIKIYHPHHPFSDKHGYVREHRLIMEKKLKRFLLLTEVVDHINGIKDDNRIINLRLFSNNTEHLKTTLKGRVPKWTKDGKKRLMKSFKNGLLVYVKNKSR